MQLIHISDLHLGKRLCEMPLSDDQRDMLSQVVRLAQQHAAQAVLISGDVYDKPVPPADAVGMLDDFLTQLCELGLPVFLISGNHDSAERLAFGARLLRDRSLYLAPACDTAHAVVTPVLLSDAWGEVAVYSLPFVKPAHVRAAFPEETVESYTDALRVLIGHMDIDPQRRNVLLCHQFVTGGERAASEDISVGGLDNVDASVFAPFDYVALGHLHRAQHVGRESVRYAGSPLCYSFGEEKDEKSVTLVELRAKGDITVSPLAIRPLHQVRTVRGSYDELTYRPFYEKTPTEDYLRVILTDEDDVPEAIGRLRAVYPNLLRLEYDNARTRTQQQVELEEKDAPQSPMALLESLYELQNNQPMSDQQRELATRLLEQAWEERP